MPKSIGKRWVAILIAVLLLVVSAVTMAFFTDRVDHSMQFTTASFSADGYTLKRTAPEGPFCAGEDVTATLKESNTGEDAINSVISMKATWVSPDTALSIFGNANAADNAKLSIDGTDISYKVSTDKKSITFDLPAHVLTAGTKDKARDLTLTIPASFKSTGRIEFTFEKVVVAQDGGGFSETYDRTQLNASKELDYSVRVGWAASSIEAQNGKALMGYLTEKDSVSGKFGIQFEYAFNYNTSPMKDFASKTDAKWSYYKDKADRLTFVEGMTSIGDYAFPDFELVTSLSLPESLVSVGKWSFDNISIPTLTLPAALTNFDTMSFGHINELTEITFNQAAKTDISFPTAGSTTGAFYVDPYVPTKIVGENPIAQGYDWITDQRRVAPVIRSYNYTWSGDRMSQPLDATTLTPDDDSNVDFHTAENRAKIKSVVFQDASGYYAIPDMKPGDAGGLVEKNNNMWDVSAAQNKSVIAWLKDDGTLIIAGDGVKVMANADSDWLFGDMANIETIDATLYDTSNATTMEYWHAFAEPDLRQNEGDWSGDPLPMEVPQRGTKQIVGIQDWDVSKVTSTMDMFYNANRLTSLNLGSWNTKSLKTPNGMFHGCSALTTLDVSGWNTSNVTTLQSIFSHCRGLTALDVAGWDVQKVTDMSFAFSDCGAPVLDLHTWKTNSLTTLEKAFAGAGANTINVTGWNTSKVITMDSAFENTASLGSLDLSTWDTSGVGRGTESDGTVFGTGAFNNMFFRSGAKSINVSGFDFSSLYGPKGNWYGGLYKMFGECKSLTEIVGAETWTNTGKIVELNSTFIDCEKLVTLNVSKWDTSGVTAMSNAFNGCKSLAELDVSKWNVSSCEGYINTFKDCESVKVLDISKWDMTKATPSASQNMFNGCKSLESLTFPTSVNWLATRMAANCPKLTTIEFLSTDASISQRPTAGASLGAFYVAPDAGVTVPVTTFIITHGSGMAQLKDASIYNLADDNRCLPLDLPVQSETLTANGSEQSPTWKNYDSSKMTISGTTSAVEAGTYTATFTLNDGYAWFDGTAEDKDVQWTMESGAPMLAASDSWYKSSVKRGQFTKIEFIDSGTPSGTIVEQWNADVDNSGSIKAYITGSSGSSGSYTLTIAGNGAGSIMANPNSRYAFSSSSELEFEFPYKYALSAVTDIAGMDLLDTSKVTNMDSMFRYCNNLTSLDVSGFDTSKVTDMSYMFSDCSKLTSLDLSGFDTSRVTTMGSMFYYCTSLTSLNLSGFDTSSVTDMSDMFYHCIKLQAVTLGKDFKFVGTNGYLPTPSATYISGADGKWYDTNTGTGYTPEALASVERTEAVTYSAVPNAKILSGMWKFNVKPAECPGNFEGICFTSNGVAYSMIGRYNFSSACQEPCKHYTMWYAYAKTTKGENRVLCDYSWDSSAYRLISFSGPQVVTEEFYNWFVENAKPVVTLEGKWKFNETLTFDTEVEATEISYTINGGTGTILYTKYDESGKFQGWKLGVASNIVADVWVYGDTGSVLTPLGWRDESYRTIAFNGTQYVTKDFYDWFIANAKPWSEDDSGAAEKVAVPKQSGTLTYNGNAQSPSWSNYDASKMTMGGTTTGTNAGSYTTTFALNDGFKWADGTTGTKSVIWKIGKATGSVSFSKDSLNIDKNSTTDTLDVTRTGTGAITATSSDTSVATVTVNGTKVTVTKVGDGTATITIKVAADANYKEASKTCSVTCVGIPTLAYGSTWYKGSTDKASVTKIQIKDSYTPSGAAAESWNADARNSGSIKAYVEGTTLTIAGNGTGKIKANALSWSVFNGFSSATAITGLDLMDTSNALTMEAMFYGCKALTALDVSKFDTSNVTSMRAMFYECENLTSLNVSKFDTAAVTNVEAMFQGCKALTAVGDVSGWNTAKVTSMYQVFYGCEKLAALDLSGWNTTNVTNMQAMFLDCTSLTSVGDLSGWNTAKVTEMALLFGNCEKLASLDVSKFNTAAVTNMNAMFFNCSALTTLDVSGFDTAKTTNLAAMFSGCVSLTSLDVSNWNTSNVTTMEATFQNCKKLTTMGDVSGWDTSKVTNMREMFCQCNLITSVNVTNWKTGNVTNMNGIFSNCEKLTSVGDLSGWDTSSATDMGLIFNSCFKLTGMGDISQWDTSNATKMNCLFATCESLTELDLSGWDTSKVTDMNNIFGGYEHEQLEEGEIAGECVLLRKITLGAKFKFVGTDSYLPEPDSRYISGADGKWYVGSTGYTPAELAGLNRTEAVTYVAVKGTKTMSILSGDNAVSGYSISE